uniref:ARAD1A05126p n=1 Tax=Blastobotrys adeninivorans TaxID=409370 RepID=A0A060T252_BLAAD
MDESSIQQWNQWMRRLSSTSHDSDQDTHERRPSMIERLASKAMEYEELVIRMFMWDTSDYVEMDEESTIESNGIRGSSFSSNLSPNLSSSP